MAQITHGVRAVLAWPPVYNFFQRCVGADLMRSEIVERYLRPWPGARLLDIGCGTAAILDHLPTLDYVGVDLSSEYIEAARRRYADRGRFLSADVADIASRVGGEFDLILACGVLHHLDDAQVRNLFGHLRPLLAPGGRLLTVDGAWVEGQAAIARILLARDRGRNIRRPDGYAGLANGYFPGVKTSIRHDVLRIPFTLCFMECSHAGATPASGQTSRQLEAR